MSIGIRIIARLEHDCLVLALQFVCGRPGVGHGLGAPQPTERMGGGGGGVEN